MKRIILVLVAFVFVLTGCAISMTGEEVEKVSDILKDHLNISPYIPKTDYEIGAVILEYQPGAEDQGPYHATISYFESLSELEEVDEESKEWWQENNPDRELVYGDLYEEPSVISIEVYPAGKFGELMNAETVEVAGHEIQYQFLKQGTDGRDSNYIFMAIDFDEVSYVIQYSVQSDNIEKDAKKLAEDIIKNNA